MKLIAVLTFFLLAVFSASSLDFSMMPHGFAVFPGGHGSITQDGHERYDIGGGGGIGLEIDFASLISNPLGLSYTAGIETSIINSPIKNYDGTLNFYSIGANIGLYLYPVSRILLGANGGLGIYNANDGEDQHPGSMWWRVGGETGFRFTPGFTITANAGWREFQNKNSGNVLYSGLYAGLGARINFELGRQSSGSVGSALNQYNAIYPVLTPLYQQIPFGSVRITNQENAEIRNVRLYFRAGDHTASEYRCGQVALIAKGRSAELPMLADFSQEILRFAASGRILGEMVIRYTFLGKEREVIQTVSVAVHNRNTIPAGDNMALAAFVSPIAPEILQYSRFVTGLARTNHRTGLNYNMLSGIWLLEAMRITGIRELENNSKINSAEVQFPSQTLANGSGSKLDIALLYAASLEAGGVNSAIIIMPTGDILCAINLGIIFDAPVTAGLFNGTDKLLILGDEAWLPVSVSRINNGFTNAWQEGVRQLHALQTSGEYAELIIIENAWANYPPVSFPSLGVPVTLPDTRTLSTSSDAAIRAYIDSEFPPLIAAVQASIRTSPTAALYNQLGNLFLRSGRINEAKAAYEQAAGLGSVGAMVTRGNLERNENNFAAAERWYRQALERDPQNAAALNALENLQARR